MAGIARIRVELREPRHNASEDEKYKAFRSMLAVFKKRVDESGILALVKQKEFYESKSQKKRRKQKESAAARHKEKLREHFGNRVAAKRKKKRGVKNEPRK